MNVEAMKNDNDDCAAAYVLTIFDRPTSKSIPLTCSSLMLKVDILTRITEFLVILIFN